MRFADGGRAVGPDAAARAERIAARINDPGLFRARIRFCEVAGRPGVEAPDRTVDGDRCLAAIDGALAAAPASGELWLYKASVLVRRGEIGPAFFEALRNSFLTSRREGWIATGRVILGLRLLPLLPEDLVKIVQSDLVLVVDDPNLSKSLASVYASDELLRNAGATALRSLSADQVYRFISLVRHAAEEAGAGAQ
jgi:hypothetical protein